MTTPDPEPALRRHIEHKVAMRELARDVADRMLAALERGEPAEYATLLEQATFLPAPPRCFHTAPRHVRHQIERDGLRPGTGENWAGLADGQPRGVYVGAEPDVRGVWAHWETWDIWEVDIADLNWTHDRLNPGCWILLDPVPAGLIRRWQASDGSGDGSGDEAGRED